ncbi:MAG: M20 family metallopeptidase [Pirellulaceae bacterium]
MSLDVVDTLRDLVRLPSVNPMGRDVSGPEYFEHQVTDYLQALFQRMGLPWERQDVAPQRANILARLDGETPPEEGGKLLVFEAHQDTVPVDGMTIEPWSGDLRDGRVWGRGSCDIKGGMSAMLAAVARLAEQRPAGLPTIVLACTVNEEHGYSGALRLAQSWLEPGRSKLLPRTPDAVIVAEPTLLDVVVAHKGATRWKLHTTGRAGHSSRPELGENAIYQMGRVLAALESYAKQEAPSLGEHALVGRPTLSVGIISGGISVNTVPDRCTIEIDRRVLPGEDPLQARQTVIDYIDRHAELSSPPVHDDPYIAAHGLSEEHNGPLAESLSAVIQQHGGTGRRTGVPYGTDAAVFAKAGAPSVVFGPGSIDQAHTCDEWLAVEQLEKAAEIYYQFAQSGMA